MTTWTDIANSEVDQDSPITQTLMTALRDNPVAIAEQSTGTIYNENMWHPYNGLKVGDGNDGVYYDGAIDGSATAIDSPAFEDGYDYMAYLQDVTATASGVSILKVSLQRSTDDGWFSAQTARESAFEPLNGLIFIPYARAVLKGHVVAPYLVSNATSTLDLYMSGFYDSTAFAVKAVRIVATANAFSGGKVALFRRRSEFA